MPVLTTTDHVPPRSALRHRPIGDDATRQEPGVSTETTPIAQRASRLRPKQTDDEEEIKEWQRADTGTTRQGRTTAAPPASWESSKEPSQNASRDASKEQGKVLAGSAPLVVSGHRDASDARAVDSALNGCELGEHHLERSPLWSPTHLPDRRPRRA
jgi:hypothetical protein